MKSKVSKLLDLATPRTKKPVRAVIGLASNYRRYVPNFADVIAPLSELTKKNQPTKVRWTQKCQDPFDQIKNVLSSEPVIAVPDFPHPFILRPIAQWRRFKIRRQASTSCESAGIATDTHYQCLYSHTSNIRTQHIWQSLDMRGQSVKMA